MLKLPTPPLNKDKNRPGLFLFCLHSENKMIGTLAAGVLAGLWVMAGTAMVASFKND